MSYLPPGGEILSVHATVVGARPYSRCPSLFSVQDIRQPFSARYMPRTGVGDYEESNRRTDDAQ
jgi:hypothetical protein